MATYSDSKGRGLGLAYARRFWMLLASDKVGKIDSLLFLSFRVSD